MKREVLEESIGAAQVMGAYSLMFSKLIACHIYFSIWGPQPWLSEVQNVHILCALWNEIIMHNVISDEQNERWYVAFQKNLGVTYFWEFRDFYIKEPQSIAWNLKPRKPLPALARRYLLNICQFIKTSRVKTRWQ